MEGGSEDEEMRTIGLRWVIIPSTSEVRIRQRNLVASALRPRRPRVQEPKIQKPRGSGAQGGTGFGAQGAKGPSAQAPKARGQGTKARRLDGQKAK